MQPSESRSSGDQRQLARLVSSEQQLDQVQVLCRFGVGTLRCLASPSAMVLHAQRLRFWGIVWHVACQVTYPQAGCTAHSVVVMVRVCCGLIT